MTVKKVRSQVVVFEQSSPKLAAIEAMKDGFAIECRPLIEKTCKFVGQGYFHATFEERDDSYHVIGAVVTELNPGTFLVYLTSEPTMYKNIGQKAESLRATVGFVQAFVSNLDGSALHQFVQQKLPDIREELFREQFNVADYLFINADAAAAAIKAWYEVSQNEDCLRKRLAKEMNIAL